MKLCCMGVSLLFIYSLCSNLLSILAWTCLANLTNANKLFDRLLYLVLFDGVRVRAIELLDSGIKVAAGIGQST